MREARRVHRACRACASGPLGGDQQIGALIAEGKVDALIFFVDPLTPMPHDVDVKALMRLAIVYDIPMALNRATAEIVLLKKRAAEAAVDGDGSDNAWLSGPTSGRCNSRS